MKKVLFISNSFGLGGSEKALAEMINNMDLSKFDITLLALNNVKSQLVFKDGVNTINGYDGFEELTEPLRMAVLHLIRKGKFVLLFKKVLFSLQCRFNFKKTHISKFFWQRLGSEVKRIDKFYDVVIGYGQNMPTYFLKDKVNADKKVAWVNTDLKKAGYDIKYIRQFYDAVDEIVTVSQTGKKNILELFPDINKEIYVFNDILDVNGMKQKSNAEGDPFVDYDGLKILSVGRLVEAKAFHLAVEAASVLLEEINDFRWYILGDGPLRNKLAKQIKKLGLENTVVLLGAKANPYPYYKYCDIYVQTSIYEGLPIAVREAMIFEKPIVCTNFPSAFELITNNVNGVIAHMDGISISESLKFLAKNKKKQNEFCEYLRMHPFEYTEQIKHLDAII